MAFKEKDIRDPDVLQKYFALVAKDSAKMLSSNNAMERLDQKKWGLGESLFEFEKGGYIYERCTITDTLFVNPRPKFDVLMDFYSSSESSTYWVNEFFLPKINERREKIFKPRAEFISNKFSNNLYEMRIGDIGAGFGLFIEELKKINNVELDIEAIEPSENMAKICRDKGIVVKEAMLENLVDETEKYDLLTTFELFEHLHDPLLFLNDCYDLLNPGGYIYLTTLNSHGFDIRVLWEESNSIFPPHHLNFFNPISMDKIMSLVGFNNIEITTPGELDIDIVKNVYEKGNVDLPRFLSSLYNYSSGDVLNNFQLFIQNNNLSSHMRIIAQKPLI